MNTICLTCFILSTVNSSINQKGSNKVVYNFNSFSRYVLVSLINTNMGLANVKRLKLLFSLNNSVRPFPIPWQLTLSPQYLKNGKDCNNITVWDDNILQIFVFNKLKLCLIRRISLSSKEVVKKRIFFLHFVGWHWINI